MLNEMSTEPRWTLGLHKVGQPTPHSFPALLGNGHTCSAIHAAVEHLTTLWTWNEPHQYKQTQMQPNIPVLATHHPLTLKLGNKVASYSVTNSEILV